MASMRDAMVRNLKCLVEEHLAGLDWERCALMFPNEGEEEGDIAELRFVLHGASRVVRVESSEFTPPVGRVLLDMRDVGPVDVSSWEAIARLVRADRVAHEASHERHGFIGRST